MAEEGSSAAASAAPSPQAHQSVAGRDRFKPRSRRRPWRRGAPTRSLPSERGHGPSKRRPCELASSRRRHAGDRVALASGPAHVAEGQLDSADHQRRQRPGVECARCAAHRRPRRRGQGAAARARGSGHRPYGHLRRGQRGRGVPVPLLRRRPGRPPSGFGRRGGRRGRPRHADRALSAPAASTSRPGMRRRWRPFLTATRRRTASRSASRPPPRSSPSARTTDAMRAPRSWSRPRPRASGSALLPLSRRPRRPGPDSSRPGT